MLSVRSFGRRTLGLVIEAIEAIVEIVDAELIQDKKYAAMGKTPADRVKELLGRLHSITNSKDRGSQVSRKAELLLGKFAQQLRNIFKNLPKPVEWRSFYNNDFPILMDICKEVREISIQDGLNRSQTRALETLKTVSQEEFQRVTAHGLEPSNSGVGSDGKSEPNLSANSANLFLREPLKMIVS